MYVLGILIRIYMRSNQGETVLLEAVPLFLLCIGVLAEYKKDYQPPLALQVPFGKGVDSFLCTR